jgi:hypothetical protein
MLNYISLLEKLTSKDGNYIYELEEFYETLY